MSKTDDMTIEEIFNDCVDILQSGGSVEECLSLYSEHASELKPMLTTVQSTRAAYDEINPLPASKARIQIAVMQAFSQQNEKAQANSYFHNIFRKPAAVFAVAALLILLISGTGLTALSQSAMPNDALYGWKKASENVELFFNFTQDGKTQQAHKMAERRAQEMAVLAESGGTSAQIYNVYLDFKKSYCTTAAYALGSKPAQIDYANYTFTLNGDDLHNSIGIYLNDTLFTLTLLRDTPNTGPIISPGEILVIDRMIDEINTMVAS